MHTSMKPYRDISALLHNLLACVKAGTVGFLGYPVTVLLYYKGTIYITISFKTDKLSSNKH